MIKNIELKKQTEINDIKTFRVLLQKCFDTLGIQDKIINLDTPLKSSKNRLGSGENGKLDDK